MPAVIRHDWTRDEVVAFLRASGFALERLTSVGGKHGCNEFVLRRA